MTDRKPSLREIAVKHGIDLSKTREMSEEEFDVLTGRPFASDILPEDEDERSEDEHHND